MFLIAGVFGTLSFLGSVPGIRYSGMLIYTAAVVMCSGIWYVYFYKRTLFLPVTGGSVFFLLAAAWRFRESLAVQAEQMAADIWALAGGSPVSGEKITFLMIFTVYGLALVFFIIEFILRCHLVLYLLTTALLIGAPVMEVDLNVLTVFCFLVFQYGFWIGRGVKVRKNKNLLAEEKNMGSAEKILQIAVILLLTGMVISGVSAAVFKDKFFDAEKFFYREISKRAGYGTAPEASGKINMGNNFPLGDNHLKITVSGKTTENLYLYGFRGGEYLGGAWTEAEDEKKLSEDLFYRMNKQSVPRAEEHYLMIAHFNGGYETLYLPYFGERETNYSSGNSAFFSEPGEKVYRYHYFEEDNLEIDWSYNGKVAEAMRQASVKEKEAYRYYAKEEYTRVDRELVPKLSRLAEDFSLDDLDEITTFILYILHSNAIYDLTPGRAPDDEEIAEYFLFENQRGYCQHFALTATLLYRLYGVPARYVSGYMVTPSRFEKVEGSEAEAWRAIATDENAHAWVEIFLDDYGWTPVEMTPAKNGSFVTRYPGYDEAVYREVLSDKDWENSIKDLSAYSDGGKSSYSAGSGRFGKSIRQMDGKKRVFLSIVCILILLILLVLSFVYRRIRQLERIRRMGCRRTFDRLMDLLHEYGYLKELDGSEEYFAERFEREIGCFQAEEVRKLQQIVSVAAYGKRALTIQEKKYVRRFYFRVRRYICENLKKHQKIWFQYMKEY